MRCALHPESLLLLLAGLFDVVLLCVDVEHVMASVTTWLPVPAPAPSRRLSREDAVNAEMKMQFSEGGGGTAAIACHASSVWQVWNDAAGNANADTADLFGILATHEADAQVDIHTSSGAVSAQDKAARKARKTNGDVNVMLDIDRDYELLYIVCCVCYVYISYTLSLSRVKDQVHP